MSEAVAVGLDDAAALAESEAAAVRVGEADVDTFFVRVAEAEAAVAVADSEAQGFALEARVARLRALAQGTTFLPPAATSDEERAIGVRVARLRRPVA